MNVPAVDEKDFYERRDDRQRRVAANDDYQSVQTAIVAGGAVTEIRSGQQAILTAANLLARWSRCVRLAFPNAGLHPSLANEGQQDLHGAAREVMSRADPFGDFTTTAPQSDALVLQVGPDPEELGGAPSIAVWGEGWEAVGWAPAQERAPVRSVDGPVFEPSLQLAVCLGVGQLFKEALGQAEAKHLTGFRWSLWGQQRRPLTASAQDGASEIPRSSGSYLGRLLHVGVGAVGSCVLYYLDLLDVEADVVVVDYDLVEVENLDRSLLFGWPDAIPEEQAKVRAAEARLADSTVRVRSFQGSWREYVDDRLSGDGPFDVWLPLANEYGVRRSMAMNLPPLMLHGSTSRDWGVFLGRHIPLRDYCLHCRFPEEGAQASFPCGEGDPVAEPDRPKDEQIDPSLPFVSAAAAALVVGEVLKLGVSDYADQPNYVSVNLKSSMENVVALEHPRREGCPTCKHLLREHWSDRYGGSKYAHLSDG